MRRPKTTPALGEDPLRNDDFSYANDPDGKQAPLGCHMRRMNPRDTKMPVLTDVNIHRIIRRSTTYGAPYDPNALSERDDEVPRGLYFLFISAKAMATMEFLQREWINSGDFMALGDERDPIVGLQDEAATFTIPKDPVRRRVHGIQTFNVLARRRVFLHAEPVRAEMAGGSRRLMQGPLDITRINHHGQGSL